MTIRSWAGRGVAAGVLAAALVAPVAGTVAAAPAPAPPVDPVTKASNAACSTWSKNQRPRADKHQASVKATKVDGWTWASIAPQLDEEVAATRVEIGTLNGTIAQAAPKPALVTALRTYQAKLDALITAIGTDRAAGQYGDATWRAGNPVLAELRTANTAVVDACNG